MNEKKTVKLEIISPSIVPNVYLLHSSGGFHYFSTCSEDKHIKEIYRQNIWPWIEVLKNNEGIEYKTYRYPRPTKRDPYPKLNLRVKGEKIKLNSIPNGLYPFKTLYIHRLIAKAFLKNEFNLPVVDHINSHTVDYRIENLRWLSHSENNTGKRPKIGSDKLYDIYRHKKLI